MSRERFIVWRETNESVNEYVLTKVHSTTIKDAIRNIESSSIETPILPFGTVLMKKDKNTTVFFIQRPEEKQTIRYCEQFFTIALPWRVLAFKFTGHLLVDYHLLFAKKPIHHMRDMLYLSPLPNIDDDGAVCVGCNMISTIGKTGPLSIIAQKAIEWIDKTGYNDDLNQNIRTLPREMNPDKVAIEKTDTAFSLWQTWVDENDNWRRINDLTWSDHESFEKFVERIN